MEVRRHNEGQKKKKSMLTVFISWQSSLWLITNLSSEKLNCNTWPKVCGRLTAFTLHLETVKGLHRNDDLRRCPHSSERAHPVLCYTDEWNQASYSIRWHSMTEKWHSHVSAAGWVVRLACNRFIYLPQAIKYRHQFLADKIWLGTMWKRLTSLNLLSTCPYGRFSLMLLSTISRVSCWNLPTQRLCCQIWSDHTYFNAHMLRWCHYNRKSKR